MRLISQEAGGHTCTASASHVTLRFGVPRTSWTLPLRCGSDEAAITARIRGVEEYTDGSRSERALVLERRWKADSYRASDAVWYSPSRGLLLRQVVTYHFEDGRILEQTEELR